MEQSRYSLAAQVIGPESARTEIHVVEDHPIYRAALVHALGSAGDMRVGVSAASVEEFAAYRRPPGTVVILDQQLPGVRDAEAVATVVRMGFVVLVLSAHGDRSNVLAALAAGASGYLTKAADIDEICRAVRTVAAGDRYLSPKLTTLVLDASPLRSRTTQPSLSDRERQVLALLADGERDQDIATALSISVRTVRSHLDRIREKTGRRRRPELTRLAIEKGIVNHRDELRP